MSLRASSILLAALALPPASLAAQRVSADISIGHGPVSGHILIGDPYPIYHRDAIVVRHYRPYRPVYREVIVVRGHRGHGWYKNHGYRVVRIWYDRDRRAYYHDRPRRDYYGLHPVVVYERDGRYYREYDRRDRGDWDRDWDRRDRDRDRWDRDDGEDWDYDREDRHYR